MRILLTAMIVATPVAAFAQPVEAPMLKENLDRCIQTCAEDHGVGFCADMCGCMTGEIERHWTMEQFTARMERLRQDPADPEVQDEMSRLADYCAERM